MRIALLLAALLTGACVKPPPPGVTVLNYATPYAPAHPFSRADAAWMRFVEQRSAGRIRIVPHWSGALLSADQSMEELRHGVADIGLITPIYTRGGTQLIRTQAGFYAGARTYPQQTALYRCMAAAEPHFAREMAGLHILAIQGGGLPGIVTRDRPVRSLADLRGLRLRAPTELLPVLDALGADPVNMPMGEVYSALAKGVLDGVVAPPDTLRALHFAEVARHFTELEVPRGAYPARAMSDRRWAQLPPAARTVLTEGTRVWEAALADEIASAEETGVQEGRKQGVTFHPMTPGDQRRFDAIYDGEAARGAAALARYGIDGTRVYRRARAIAAALPQGLPACGGIG